MLPGLAGASPAQEQVSGISGGGGCSAAHSQLLVVKPQAELPLTGPHSHPVTGGTLRAGSQVRVLAGGCGCS